MSRKSPENDFPRPLVTVDTVLFSYHEDRLKLLLVRRASEPEAGKWGLPGGFVDMTEDQTLEDTVYRKLKDKTGIEPPYLEQVRTYGDSTRDARGWSVTVCFTALIALQSTASRVDSVADSQWTPLDEVELEALAFDHGVLVRDARDRLRQKALYSIVPAYALPREFTLPELQRLHEALIGKPLQKKSFRRRIEQANLVIDTGKKRSEAGRPAALYRLRAKAAEHYFVRNLES